jgi:malate dehydrogenase (quinone)
LSHLKTDVLLVGGGIMSATLGLLLQKLNPSLNILMIEQLPEVAMESSSALNNAGTGHAGYCELNYTPQLADGSVNTTRALEINAAFETSLQLWSSLVESGALPSPEHFINKTPHLSFVWGNDNVAFLKQRFAQLKQHHLFADMQYSEDFEQLKSWMPLIMSNRQNNQPMAATYVDYGSDVNFGALTRYLVSYLKENANFSLMTNTRITQIKRLNDTQDHASWVISATNRQTKVTHKIHAKFVFLGAGGGALPLLQKADIPESIGYGGFPVSGQWLICNNEALVKQHGSKVYGKAAVGAPPMSVPHLDARMIDGKPALLFGPFAGFTTKFLKQGSRLDLAKSIQSKNLKSMLGAGKHNLDLTKYLVKEVFQTQKQRIKALHDFLPDAKNSDWKLANAGQRVQIIKQCNQNWGKLEFGTEIVASSDGSIAALLGASPGASVSVQAMLDVLEKCFSEELKNNDWQDKLRELIPSYGCSLIEDAELLRKVRKTTLRTLKLS